MTIGDAGVILALVTSAAGFLTATASRRKLHAEESKIKSDAAESILESAMTLLEPLKVRLADAEKIIAENKIQIDIMDMEVRALKIQNAEMREGIEKLKYQILSLGHKPIYEGNNI